MTRLKRAATVAALAMLAAAVALVLAESTGALPSGFRFLGQ